MADPAAPRRFAPLSASPSLIADDKLLAEIPSLRPLRDAMAALQDGLEKIGGEVAAIRNDPTKTAVGKEISVRDHVHRRLQALTRRVDHAREAALARLDALDSALAKNRGQQTPFSPEIRAALRKMSGEDRSRLLAQALANGDETTLGAVLGGAPAYLSGLQPHEVQMLAHQFRQKFAPEEHAEATALRKAIRAVELGGADSVTAATKLYDGHAIDAASEAIARAQAATRAAE